MTEGEDLIINLCPTGMVPRRDKVPHVPVDPQEIAADVRRCRDAGASMVHIHARRDDEEPTWEAGRFRDTVEAVLAATPDIVVVVTTSGRNWSEFERRSASLTLDGDAKPEMASLTLGSLNFAREASVNDPAMIRQLAAEMHARGIVPELEIFDVGMANFASALVAEGALRPPYYCNVLLGSKGTADLSAVNLGAVLASLPQGATWALAGIGRYQTAACATALALGGHVRIGLEDNPYYDWSTREPASNPRLVERIVRIAREVGRHPVEPVRARQIIGLDEPARLRAGVPA